MNFPSFTDVANYFGKINHPCEKAGYTNKIVDNEAGSYTGNNGFSIFSKNPYYVYTNDSGSYCTESLAAEITGAKNGKTLTVAGDKNTVKANGPLTLTDARHNKLYTCASKKEISGFNSTNSLICKQVIAQNDWFVRKII